MLKIKDNVDLKELEKFELTTTKGNNYYIYYTLGEYIKINKETRIIIIGSVWTYSEQIKILTKLFQLIKADLVE